MRLGLQAARIRLGTVLFHKPIEKRPRNMLQKSMKNDILVLHGVVLSRVQLIRKLLEPSRINAVHLIKHKPCRTAVGSTRASIIKWAFLATEDGLPGRARQ